MPPKRYVLIIVLATFRVPNMLSATSHLFLILLRRPTPQLKLQEEARRVQVRSRSHVSEIVSEVRRKMAQVKVRFSK